MARPSNDELLEERRAIAAILETKDDESNVDALNQMIEAYNARIAELEAGTDRASEVAPEVNGYPCDPAGWPIKPELQDGRGVKTPAYLRWMAEELPEIYAAKRGGQPLPEAE